MNKLGPAMDQGTLIIKVKRVYESPELGEGSRFLVDRLWPRGLKKEALRGTLWVKDVAPGDALRRWYGHDPKKWREFRRRYFAELDDKREAWEPILQAARRGGVVLLYSARDADHNNGVALRDYLATKIKKGENAGASVSRTEKRSRRCSPSKPVESKILRGSRECECASLKSEKA
ncbi:MAG TPA: DUF488 family protein [Candidatus Binatia bacterium]|nr:DUF488 family protein [Candidatus Binatia bacterium]